MMSISTVLQGSGNCRWMAIELLFHDALPTKESDMWSFGMVILEVRLATFANRGEQHSWSFINSCSPIDRHSGRRATRHR